VIPYGTWVSVSVRLVCKLLYTVYVCYSAFYNLHFCFSGVPHSLLSSCFKLMVTDVTWCRLTIYDSNKLEILIYYCSIACGALSPFRGRRAMSHHCVGIRVCVKYSVMCPSGGGRRSCSTHRVTERSFVSGDTERHETLSHPAGRYPSHSLWGKYHARTSVCVRVWVGGCGCGSVCGYDAASQSVFLVIFIIDSW